MHATFFFQLDPDCGFGAWSEHWGGRHWRLLWASGPALERNAGVGSQRWICCI